MTLAEAAASLRVHPDLVLRYADIGILVPAALVPRTSLSPTALAPAPYVVVLLHDYLDMLWADNGAGDLVAPIVGSHRVYQVDGTAHIEVEFDATVIVRRSQLAFLADGIDGLREPSAEPVGRQKTPHPAKLRTLQQILGMLIADRWANAGPYTVAEEMVRAFQLRGLNISKECVASHVKECRRELDAAPNADEGCRANSDGLAQAA
jgi:hypothetical protein